MKAWACKRCDQIHTQNPDECRNCGHRIFRPVSEDELRDRSTDTETPESVSVGTTVGGSKEIDSGGSPDVNLDGSISDPDPEEHDSAEVEKGLFGRIADWFRS